MKRSHKYISGWKNSTKRVEELTIVHDLGELIHKFLIRFTNSAIKLSDLNESV